MGIVGALTAPLVRRLVYHGALTRTGPDDADVSFERPGGVVLRGWTTRTTAGRAALYLGGNAEDVRGWQGTMAHWLPTHSGYLVAYRGFGASDGRPSERALVGDAVAIHDELARRHPDGPVDVIGRSLGSGVAVQLAARRPVGRLVLVTPFDCLARVADDVVPGPLPVAWLVGDRFDSAAAAPRVTAPVLVLRAARDELVRPPRTDRLVAAFTTPPEVVDFPEADHVSIAQDRRYWRAVATFLGGRDASES